MSSSRGTPGIRCAAIAVVLIAAWSAHALATRPHRPGAAAPPPLVRIDLNTASTDELALLPGIGPALAGAIVLERERGGDFASVDDLARVRGVGPVTIDSAREHAVARPR